MDRADEWMGQTKNGFERKGKIAGMKMGECSSDR